jgi:aryl carrier-like protein
MQLSSIEPDPAVLNSKSAGEIVTLEIGKRIYILMPQPPYEVDVLQSLEGLGVDSLVTIEVRAWWRRSLGFEVSALEILNAATIQGLGELAINGLQAKFTTKTKALV